MQRYEYLRIETRHNEVININGEDPRQREKWNIFGLTISNITGGKLIEHEFLNVIGKEGWEIVGMGPTDVGTMVLIAKRPY